MRVAFEFALQFVFDTLNRLSSEFKFKFASRWRSNWSISESEFSVFPAFSDSIHTNI